MASTSTSSVQKSFKYDVFLSFRGEDTRHNFVSHLYKALEQHGIQTYKDDEKIEKGRTIDTHLIKSIEESRFFIIVFSKNYAGSSWCLDELAKIMECRKESEQTAYPIFYDVKPTEIRKQSGAVGDAFIKHENKEAAEKWRKALNEAGNLAGWESKNTANGDESKLIEVIVDDIFEKISFGNWVANEKFVGMETRIEAVLSSLELDVDDVRMIGIWGMGGGGKTTLAKAVFDRISVQFEGKAFVENVREISSSGLKQLQQYIISSVLNKGNIDVRSVHEGTNMMKKIMRGIKVLIVLDDVDDIEQLEALAGEPNWFKLGSRVIITTRDKQVLVAHRVSFINSVTLLSETEAIRLFNTYAFTKETPIRGYNELSRQVLKYAQGLPLTIKVLGSLLCGQNERQWKDVLERLKTIPLKETMKILELSYDALDADHKEIFLDIACILKGWEKDDAVGALESCGYFAEAGLKVLEQKSLITISKYRELLRMHDHIEEMGKNIVRRVNPNEPAMHSRLWTGKEFDEILAINSVKEEKRWWKLAGKKTLLQGEMATQAATLRMGRLDVSRVEILMNGLTKMKGLRFLHLHTLALWEDEVSNLPNALRFLVDSPYACKEKVLKNWNLPNALRFLRWDFCPFNCLPITFLPNYLVGLHMEYNHIQQLWEEKPLLKLRFLKFHFSELRTLEFSVAPNLETLILGNCPYLVELNFQVTSNLKELRIYQCALFKNLHMAAECPKLTSLHLSSCRNLRTLHLGITPNLEKLSICDCNNMVELRMPAEYPKLVDVVLNNLKLSTLHLGMTPNLESLGVKNCTDMVELHMPAECPKLVNLDLSNLKLRTLHLGITPNLETASLTDCRDLFELHIPAECLKLANLNLSNCIKVVELPEDIGRSECLEELDITGTGISRLPESILRLNGLRIVGSRQLLESCGFTPKIQTSDDETLYYIT